ncbi:MAG: hypothetical protein OXF08_03130 [Bacteroidetes bacterium]|nr:hypothetical protein [Bacteroidota bacterium]
MNDYLWLSSPPCLVDQTIIGDMTPTSISEELPSIVHMQEDSEWHENALMPFLDQVLEERVDEIDILLNMLRSH